MKAHLKTCEEPISDGTFQTADCGKQLEKAFIQFVWDALDVGTTIPLNTLAICSDCVHKVIGSAESRPRYIYGISDKPAIKGEQ